MRRAIATLIGVGALACAPGAAAAADDCPNAGIRAAQGATRLPDCRAYELVSPPKKGGNPIFAPFAVQADGEAVAYTSTGVFSADALSSLTGNYVARRTPDGWVSTIVSPPTTGRTAGAYDQWLPAALSADMSRMLIDTTYPVDPDDQGDDPGGAGFGGSIDLYRSELDGSFTWISKGMTVPETSYADVVFGWASPDLERILFETRRALTPDVPDESTWQIYLRDGDRLILLSAGDDGRPMPADARLGDGSARGGVNGVQVGGRLARAVSDDLGAIAFTSATADGAQVFVRLGGLNPATAVTRHVSRSELDGRGCGSNVRFLTMSRDGARILFTCNTQLTADAPTNGGLYEYDVATGDVRLLAASLNATAISSNLKYVTGDRDASYVYFFSTAPLTADAPTTGVKFYVLHDGVTRVVATGRTTTVLPADREATVTPDGARIAFAARIELDPERDTGGREQIFLYDATTEAIRCVSCRADGSPTATDAAFIAVGASEFSLSMHVEPIGNLSADGEDVYFATADGLVPEDINGVSDVYLYRDGTHYLLSSGTDPYASAFGGASADGTDVFIATHASLVPQDIDDSVTDLYSLRINGGIPAPAPAPSCDADCQGPPTTPPTPKVPGSFTFVGPDDVDERPAARTAAVFAVAPIGARDRAALVRRGRATLRVRVSHAGTVRATASARIGRRSVKVASASRRALEGGTVKLTLRLSKRARRHLRQAGSLRLTVAVRYSQASGVQRTTLTLRKAGGRR